MRPAPTGRTVVFACLEADTLGGAQRVAHMVAQGLAGRGYDVHLLGLHRTADPFRHIERPAYHRHLVHRGTAGRLGRIARRLGDRRLRALFRRLGPGQVIMTSPSVVTRLLPLVPAHLQRVGHYHGSFEHAGGTWQLASVRRHWADLEQAVFLSAQDAARFAEHALLPNTWSIPNPLPGWPAAPSPATGRRVLGVGRLTGVKRFDRLITAFAAACRTVGQPWELRLVGDGPELAALREHARALGVAGRVVFRGRVPAEAMRAEYLGATIVALASEHEGLPLVLGEAASYGLPAAAFDVSGGVRSLVRHGRTGLLAPAGDVGALAEALARLMASPEERRRMGAAARAHAEDFRLPRVLDRWEALFAHLSR